MIYTTLKSFRKSEEGAIAVETALIMTLLITIALGVLDFGLLISRKMEVTNAVRAGAQYALVRKPVLDSTVDGYDAYAAIKAATLEGLIANNRASNTVVAANLACSCGSTVSICFGTDPVPDDAAPVGTDLSCTSGIHTGIRRSSYLTISLRETYSFIFGFVGTAQTIVIYDEASVRLN